MNDRSRTPENSDSDRPAYHSANQQLQAGRTDCQEPPVSRELVDSVREKLASTGYHQLLRIDVAAEGSNVRLSGRVGRYYLLQVAQQAVLETAGVSSLQNDLQVVPASSGR
jgi:osmotically-inducible protein OsmY